MNQYVLKQVCKIAGSAVVILALMVAAIPVGTAMFPSSTVAEHSYVHAASKKITIKFKGNGGKASKTSKRVTTGKKYGKLPSAKRSNYYFKGWYTSKSGGKKISANSKVLYKKTKTLYAHWGKLYQNNKKLINRFGKSFAQIEAEVGSLEFLDNSNKMFWYQAGSGSGVVYGFGDYAGPDDKCIRIVGSVGSIFPQYKSTLPVKTFAVRTGIKYKIINGDYDVGGSDDGAYDGCLEFKLHGQRINIDPGSDGKVSRDDYMRIFM